MISWNDRKPKLDLRDWSPEHDKMGKGITLSHEEAIAGPETALRKQIDHLQFDTYTQDQPWLDFGSLAARPGVNGLFGADIFINGRPIIDLDQIGDQVIKSSLGILSQLFRLLPKLTQLQIPSLLSI